MAVRWQIKFRNMDDIKLRVDIYDPSYSGNTPIQLTPGSSPISTKEDDSDEVVMPIRTQSGYIRFMVKDASILDIIKPQSFVDRPVVLRYDSTLTDVLWVGFLKPEQYTQPWRPTPYEIELPLLGVLATMQNIEFTQSEGYVSIFSLFQTIASYIPIPLYLDAPDSIDPADICVINNNFRDYLTIAERADADTQNIYECLSLFEVFEEFAKYFGFVVHEFYDHIACTIFDYNEDYTQYDEQGNYDHSHVGGLVNESSGFFILRGNDNTQSYTKKIKRVKGTFTLNTEKIENIYDQDDFFKTFSVKGFPYPSNPAQLVFYGNSEFLPYRNGIQEASWLNPEYHTASGGQIVRLKDTGLLVSQPWKDYFFIYSLKDKIGDYHDGIKFNIPKYVYINANELVGINISASVDPFYKATQGGDFIKKIGVKLKLGNFWLQSIQNPGSTVFAYTWTTTETKCYIEVKSNNIATRELANYRLSASLTSLTGLLVSPPSDLAAGYYPIYFELLCDFEQSSDFDVYSGIGYLISNLKLSVLRAKESPYEPTPNLESNSYSYLSDGQIKNEYTFDCLITTKRGTQQGTGAAITANKSYVTTFYDKLGVEKRANILGISRELLKVKIKDLIIPGCFLRKTNGNIYAVISQSMNWKESKNEIQLMRFNYD